MNDSKSDQNAIQALREKSARGNVLTDEDRATVSSFQQALESQEATYLIPVIEKLQHQRQEQEALIVHLEELRSQKNSRLSTIGQLVAEIESIEAEENRVLVEIKA